MTSIRSALRFSPGYGRWKIRAARLKMIVHVWFSFVLSLFANREILIQVQRL
jgi:hypothetical protein